MEKFTEFVLQFGSLNKQQIDLIKSKATELVLQKGDYYWEAGKTGIPNKKWTNFERGLCRLFKVVVD